MRWMERISEGEPPLIFGDGSQTMDFVFVEDIARANILAATSDATDDVFNIASGVETSLVELADKLLAVMGSNLAVEFGPERAVNKVSRRLADISRPRRPGLRGRGRPRRGPGQPRRVVACRAGAPPRRARGDS